MLFRGQNKSGQCGVEVEGLILKPRQVPNLPSQRIERLFAGHRHSALLTRNGSLLVWGQNTSGELGIGRWSETAAQPTPIQALNGHEAIRTMAIGHSHIIFADQRGGLLASGSNAYGQLGLGTPLPSQYSQPDWAQASTPEESIPVMVIKRRIEKRVRISCWHVWMHSPCHWPDTAPQCRLPGCALWHSMIPCHCRSPLQCVVAWKLGMLDCLQCMQLQHVGLPTEATGELVAPQLVGIPMKQRQLELAFLNMHHRVAASAAQATSMRAAAAGLQDVRALMEWNGIGSAQMHSPARLGLRVEDILGLQTGQPLPRTAISLAEVSLCFRRAVPNCSLALEHDVHSPGSKEEC